MEYLYGVPHIRHLQLGCHLLLRRRLLLSRGSGWGWGPTVFAFAGIGGRIGGGCCGEERRGRSEGKEGVSCGLHDGMGGQGMYLER
jgi:hypothetical protein